LLNDEKGQDEEEQKPALLPMLEAESERRNNDIIASWLTT